MLIYEYIFNLVDINILDHEYCLVDLDVYMGIYIFNLVDINILDHDYYSVDLDVNTGIYIFNYSSY